MGTRWPMTRKSRGPCGPQGCVLAAYPEVACLPGRLAQEVGWKFQAVTATLEGKGKEGQPMRLKKQAKKKVAKKTHRYHILLTHSSISRYANCFLLWAIVNNSVVSMGVQITL